MNHIYTGLDIGNGEIKIVVVNASDNKYHVLASTSVKTVGLKKNVIYDDKKLKTSLLNAIKLTEEKIGMRIKEVIKEKGYTQKEFAEKLGMTTVGLAQIIAGKPSYTTLEKIADALEVEIWELLISKGEIVGNSNAASLTCPHCGKSITLKAE